MKQLGNIPIFNIFGTLFRNFIGNFFRIYLEYLKGMYNEYFMNLYFLVGSLFSHDINTSATHLNKNLRKFSVLMENENPYPSKQAQEVIFSCKLQKINHPSIYCSNNPIEHVASEKKNIWGWF